MTSIVNLNRSLYYVDISSHYDHAANKCYLLFQLYVERSLVIESDTVPSIKISRISIVNLMCTLKLRSFNNKQEKEVTMKLPTVLDPIQSNINFRE